MRSTGFKSVRTKILAAFLVTAIGMVGSGGFMLLKMRDTYQLVEQAKTRQLSPTQHARALIYDLNSSTSAETSAIAFLSRPNGGEVVRVSLKTAITAMLRARDDAASLKKDDLDASVRPVAATYLKSVAALDALVSPNMSQTPEQFGQTIANSPRDAKSIAASTKVFTDVDASGAALVTALDKAAVRDQKSAHDLYRNGVRAAIAILAAAILLAIVLGLIVAQSIRRPLKQAVTVLEDVANGDLTQRLEVHSADEVGQMAIALNSTLSTVHDVIQQIESDAGKLSSLAGTQSSASGVTVGSVGELAELAEMAESLNAMISVFHTESSPA
jgi:methyl-accepting chemotaxis protein